MLKARLGLFLSCTLGLAAVGWVTPARAWPDVGLDALAQASEDYANHRDQGNPLEEIQLLKSYQAARQAVSQSDPEAWIQQGILEAEAGLYPAALATFTAITDYFNGKDAEHPSLTSPLQARLQYGRARVLAFQGKSAEAQKLLKQALSTDPKLAQAQIVLAKVEKLLAKNAGPDPCDQAMPQLQNLNPVQLTGCIKQALPDDPNLNLLLYQLGQRQNPAYVTLLSPFLKDPQHHAAATFALSQLLVQQQLFLLTPYLAEVPTSEAILKVLRRQQSQILPALRNQLGAQLVQKIQSPQADPKSRLLWIEMLGVLRYSPALSFFRQLGRFAEELADGESVSKGNYLYGDRYWTHEIDYGAEVENKIEVARNEFSKTELMQVASEGRSERVQQLLQQRVSASTASARGETALSLAIAQSHPEIVKLLLDAGVSPNSKGPEQEPALILAVRLGQLDTVKLLLNKGVDLNCKDAKGNTPLMYAAEKGSPEMLRLLSGGSNALNVSDADGKTPLMWATAANQLETVKAMLKAGAKPENQSHSALVVAIQNKNAELFQVLLDAGANPNGVPTGDLPLNEALKLNQLKMVKTLLAKGALPDQASPSLVARMGDTELLQIVLAKVQVNLRQGCVNSALFAAAEAGKLEAARFLLDQKAELIAFEPIGNTALIAAAWDGRLDLVDLLLKKGKGDFLNLRNDYGDSALLVAAGYKYWDVVKRLLDQGADYRILNKKGEGLLKMAAQHNQIQLVEWLLGQGTDLNTRTTAFVAAVAQGHLEPVRRLFEKGVNAQVKGYNGRTLLMSAIDGGYLDVVRYLLEQKVNPNETDNDGNSPLILASGELFPKPEMVKLLLAKGANVNARDKTGKTALMAASEMGMDGRLDLIKVLLEHAVDIKATDNLGRTALMYAASQNQVETIKVLLAKGADPKARDKAGKTALMLAKESGREDAVKYLQQLK